MWHLVPSTNYEGYNGRVQLNTAAICSRARLPNQERGINKARAAGPHADPDQLCLCQYGAIYRMFPTRMQRQEGRGGRRGGKHVGTEGERIEDKKRENEYCTVKTWEMCWEKRKGFAHFEQLELIWKYPNIVAWCIISTYVAKITYFIYLILDIGREKNTGQ